ncbi:MAG: NfeD family protein [Candidatus Thorarchaeota archaeon]|nr:NfeD family protein [Candidatus Thorarchaeota archaeon]
MTKLSKRAKFLVITIDELLLIPIVLALLLVLVPEYFLPAVLIALVGTPLFLAVKYYVIYPVLGDESYANYDLSGQSGRVYETVTPTGGKVKVGAEIWEARCETGSIPCGMDVMIVVREGLRLVVRPQK